MRIFALLDSFFHSHAKHDDITRLRYCLPFARLAACFVPSLPPSLFQSKLRTERKRMTDRYSKLSNEVDGDINEQRDVYCKTMNASSMFDSLVDKVEECAPLQAYFTKQQQNAEREEQQQQMEPW
jgi:hypothetical protein